METLSTPVLAGILSALVSAALVSIFFRVTVRRAVWRLKESRVGHNQDRKSTKSGRGWVPSELMTLFSDLEGEIVREQEQSARRQNLLTGVAHDLRGPLTSVRGFSETLLQKHRSLSDKEKDEYLLTVVANAELLSAMLDDFLELIRLDAGVAKPRIGEVSLNHLLRRIANRYRPLAQEKGLSFNCQAQEEFLFVDCDELMIERALSNFIDNALQYTPAGGTVSIRAYGTPDEAAVEVSDSGVGISSADFERIFERFYRVNKERTKSTGGGLGLGLTIAKEIIDLHGGSIAVTSEKNVGTAFTVRIPRRPRDEESSRP